MLGRQLRSCKRDALQTWCVAELQGAVRWRSQHSASAGHAAALLLRPGSSAKVHWGPCPWQRGSPALGLKAPTNLAWGTRSLG